MSKTINFGDSTYVAVEAPDRFKKIHIGKFILAVIFNRRFRHGLADTIKYAFRHYNSYRGSGSSDVIFFEEDFHERKMGD